MIIDRRDPRGENSSKYHDEFGGGHVGANGSKGEAMRSDALAGRQAVITGGSKGIAGPASLTP